MKKYISFFRLRLVVGLQYRAAAAAGIVTQFFWGFMEIMMFQAFYEADPSAFPMTREALAAYVWLQQAFLAFFAAWSFDNDIFGAILSGDIAYELCRPIHIYNMWFAKNAASRVSRGVLRCMPILIVAVFLPDPYGLRGPADTFHFLMFLLTLILGLMVIVAFSMLIYVLACFTLSADGLRILFSSAVEFFAGAVIPLPFFPEGMRKVMELLPFAAMQNVTLRVYSGDLSGVELWKAVVLQVFWMITLVALGKRLSQKAERRAVVQGG